MNAQPATSPAYSKPDDTPADTDILVFWLWRDLRWRRRMALAFGLIGVGLVLQWYTGSVLIGLLPLAGGNALLLVRGYDNRVEFGAYAPASQWQKVERSRLDGLKQLDDRMSAWDRSWIDISNGRGVISFVGLLFLLWFFGVNAVGTAWAFLPVDAAVLLLPHWFSGTRRLMRLPDLVLKGETLRKVLADQRPERHGDWAEVLMLLKGGEHPLPDDVKLKLMPHDAPDDFLGLYAQVVVNRVQGKPYPYFYVVLVAKPGVGVRQLADEFQAPAGIVAEFEEQDGVEILVLRQKTTKTSGYHTKPSRVLELLTLGRGLAHRLPVRGH